ncbi:MAG: alpha/beta fold hydrolase [Iamia sp.]
MPSAAVNGIEIAYELAGEGPPLLLLNGSGTALADSALVRAPFVERFEVLAHDSRGMGASSTPPGPWTMADHAADVLALLDHLGWERVRLAGISFGGMVSQEVAVTAPERIERLALLCTSAGGDGGGSYPLHELAEMTEEERAPVATQILDTRFTPEWLADHDDHRAIVELMAARNARERTDAEQRGQALQIEARRHHDVWDRLPRITCSTLVASGRHDGIAPPANGAAIAGRIAGAEQRLYDGGHIFFFQDPTAFPEIIEFLVG